jgi:tetratricopeptide (TPR) repeat protein
MNPKDITLAEQYFKNNDLEKSKKIIEKLLIKDPNSTRANEIIGYILANEGRFEESTFYLKIACSNKDCPPEAFYYLGKLYIKLINYPEAIILIKKSLNVGGDFYEGFHDLGVAQHKMGLNNDAIVSFEKATKIRPKSESTWSTLGILLSDVSRFHESLKCFTEALLINPNIIDYWINKGFVYRNLMQFAESLICFDRALIINPISEKAITERGLTLIEFNKLENAIFEFDKALQINPKYMPALLNKAVALNQLKEFNESIKTLNICLNINKNDSDVWCNMGVTLLNLREYEESLKCLDLSVKINNNNIEAWSNRGILLNTLNKYEESIKSYEKAISIKKNYAYAHYNSSHSYFNLGIFEKGWEEYEWRFYLKDSIKPSCVENRIRWDGSKKNNTLFIWPEQGLGEQILFSSVLHELSSFPQKIIFLIDIKLFEIYKRSFPKIFFITNEKYINFNEFDEHISLGDFAGLFRKSLSSFKFANHPYLLDNEFKTNSINKLLNYKSPIKCGISWKSFNKNIGLDKSIPLNLYEILFRSNNYSWINLQYDFDSLSTVESKLLQKYDVNSFENIDLFNDIDSVASIIKSCDFIITCSNTIAHLAGALNKLTILILPFGFGRLWYWQELSDNCYWYSSVHIFRQEKYGEWLLVFNEIQKFLENFNERKG